MPSRATRDVRLGIDYTFPGMALSNMVPIFEPDATQYSVNNARVLGQAATIAYRDEATIKSWANANGFGAESLQCFSQRNQNPVALCDTQGFIAETDLAVIVAFRGTERRSSWTG
ncbi:MAG: hypothetical protein JWN34_4644 [Bryobacterales bacterium]|nr:hypothetical protein [Bryobacterales bacterium]